MKLALAVVSAFALWLLFRGSYPRPWITKHKGGRREHRAAYSKKGFKI